MSPIVGDYPNFAKNEFSSSLILTTVFIASKSHPASQDLRGWTLSGPK
jgi:hypothetical protein